MDEWDKIILRKTDEDKSVIDIADTYKAEVGRSGSINGVKNVAPAADKSISAIAVPAENIAVSPVATTVVSQPAVKIEPELPAKPVISPYTPTVTALSRRESRLPAIAEFAGKLSTFALALSISFGVYSYAIHISNIGFKLALTGTADSLVMKTEKIRNTLASLSGAAGGRTTSQLAAPAVSLQEEVPSIVVPVSTTTVSDFKATTTFW